MEDERQKQTEAPAPDYLAAPPSRTGSSAWPVVLTVIGIGCVSLLVLMAVMAAILFPVFANARIRAKQASCQSNVKQLSLASLMYAQDWSGKLPAAGNWNGAFSPYIKNQFIVYCPSANPSEVSYALNDKLPSVSTSSTRSPADIVALFDSIPGPNQVGGAGLFPSPPRHNGGHSVGFVDGHVKWIEHSSVPSLNWDPKQAASLSMP